MTTEEVQIQGKPISDLADEFGTPLFVYDTDILERTYLELRKSLPEQVDIFYSLKANPNVSVCAFLSSLGAGAEVSSDTELVTALMAGVAPQDVIFLGPGKGTHDLASCIDRCIHAVVCESLEELRKLDQLVQERSGDECTAVLRVNPSFPTKGAGLSMGGKPKQFGIDHEILRNSKTTLSQLRHVRVKGVHAYMGTRFLDHADVVHNTHQILNTAEELSNELGIPLETVDFGGGLGVAYFDNEEDPDLTKFSENMQEVVDAFVQRNPNCRLIMEAGRYLTAVAGLYVARARYVKESMGELFVIADGGTNHHMGAATGIGSLTGRNFPIRNLTRSAGQLVRRYSITGPLCTPNDTLAKKALLPEVIPGDLLGVERAGAYSLTSSPGMFLGYGFPAEVMVHRGQAFLVRERDTTSDLLSKQRLVDLGEPR